MEEENTNTLKSVDNTSEEVLDNGLEILEEKPIEVDKDKFFNILAGAGAEGLTLTVARISKTYKSKWSDKGAEGCFIDYTFTKDSKDYQVGISYNLGVPISEETFILTSGMNIFKILAIAVDLSKADKIKVTKKFIEDTLTGVKFIGKIGSGFNTFIIDPVRKI